MGDEATIVAPALAERLFDDASQFPPGDLSLEDAVANHVRWRRSSRSVLVGRLLTPLDRSRKLARRLTADGARWEVGLVVPMGARIRATDEAAEVFAATPAFVTAIELPLSAGPAAIDLWRVAFPEAELFLEGRAPDLPAIAALGAKAKLRCGGLTADAIPSVEAVAALVRGCAELGLPFKATAGLHKPLRHYASDLGADQHGFLNLLAATALSRAGAPVEEVEAVLRATERTRLAVDDHGLADARRLFLGFGTCSIDEPVEGLECLGLLRA